MTFSSLSVGFGEKTYVSAGFSAIWVLRDTPATEVVLVDA